MQYKTFSINNRRYLGNKYKLLPFIQRVVSEECQGIRTVADIFAGTGSVASAFLDKRIITNDNLYSNYICHIAWFSPEPYSKEKIISMIRKYNAMVVEEDNYMSVHFGDTYFSKEDCRKIGFIREDIERLHKDGILNDRERALLITSLLYAMDKIANTCGHYDAYRKGAAYEQHIELAVPVPEEKLNENNLCFNTDTNALVKKIQADLVYIDPPYNSRQYCDAYHLLENVARWEKPEVYGVARKMDREALKSAYCTRSATKAFEELIESISAKYILLSYNNMAEKGNGRSNAKIRDEDLLRILKKKGKVKVFSEEYKAFTTGKSDIKENEERLFLCICGESGQELIPSALNYTGGKFKLLPQILPLFPQHMDRAVDLFCGGCNVGINLNCNQVFFNDSDPHLVGLLNTMKTLPKEDTVSGIHRIIAKYHLSMVSEKGYEYYGCNGSDGLAAYNRDRYNKLRDDFNRRAKQDSEYFLMLYVLIVYAFNNQLRFNRKGDFNLPVGKRDFNAKMQDKLECFIDRLKSGDYVFSCMEFDALDLSGLTKDSFVYADPPYFITCASYNEQGGWTAEDERRLLALLDGLNERGVRFALSNVLEAKGRTNDILKEWIQDRPDYRMIDLNYTYHNANYHRQNKEKATREILVVND
ncbi:MAG: Dam family site-specific DNA-(adenine-N6)-methyltransferase [Lachnospiraceae bacterium]|nr:Dam family site-specific DNA-(adenine-N6)-methyltransferase [Lachnospiraceae bacterium]